MKKKYSLDFSVQRDTDRLQAVKEILDTLETDPSPSELEQMASYILYGKDENGQNAIQRNETIDKDKRYKSYRTKDDKVKSLDEIMEAPGFDEQQLRSAYKRDAYIVPKPIINKPTYDKKTGEMIDPGDSDIPGMIELWESIDRWQRVLDVSSGRIPPTESDQIISDSYNLYRFKHNLIELRRHQYYLKDAYKPTINFQKLDHPKAQFYDWCGDAFYWIPYNEWQQRVTHSYTHTVSQNLKDYETRGEGAQLEVKWIICQHTFNWENPVHVRTLLNYYQQLHDKYDGKVDTYIQTLLWDYDRYVELAEFSDLRRYIIRLREIGYAYEDIIEEVRIAYDIEYSINQISTIFAKEIPNKIARTARIVRLDVDTPMNQRKQCIRCAEWYPRDNIFFSHNNVRKDGYSNICKKCERKDRLRRGVIQSDVDQRTKDPTVH